MSGGVDMNEKINHKEHKHEGCTCGHSHHHEHHDKGCGCGHEHHHEHHDEGCGCGHEHHHEHHDEGCGCGHEHHHEHEHKEHELKSTATQKTYILENLGCANCAAKMEKKIRELPEVEDATITYATKQLKIASNHQEQLLPILQKICTSIESEVVVKPKQESVRELRQEQNAKKEEKGNKKELVEIGLGAVLFAAGLLLKEEQSVISFGAFVIAYFILGRKIIWTAVKNLTKGRVFDENFLMSLATIAAFVIGEYAEAVGVMLFYRVGEWFEHLAVERSRNQIMNAVDMRPEVVNKVQGDQIVVIPSEDARVGDLLLVRPGDRIPLDGKVVEGTSRIDTSPVTGEPVPVKAEIGTAVVSGCVNTSGMLKIRVEKALEDSMVTRILNSVENAAASKPKIDRFITKFARIYTPFVVVLALGTAIIPSIMTGNWNHWIYTAITFLVISCPCALVLSVPLAFFSGIGAGSRKGILFKGGVALEALKGVKAIVMDKTGTITKGNFEVQKCVALGVSEEKLLRLAADCELASTHPIGRSIVKTAKEKGLVLTRPKSIEEISGKGVKAVFEQGTVLCGNRALMEDFHIDLSGYRDVEYGTEVLVAEDGVLIGYIVIADAIKDDAVSSIRMIKENGIQTIMLTGDAKGNAEAIAKETGVQEVYAQLLPQEKLEKLQEIREKNGAVMFVGDGINDAPVLAGADVGAAMGSGADAAIEAADVVFMTSSMEAVPQSIRIAKVTASIAMQNVVFALVIKALVMVLGLAGFANMWLAVFADTGVAMLCVLNSVRILYKK